MRTTAWTILLLLLACKGQAQVFPNLQFTYLTTKDGLSNNQVDCISQDKDGFMWFATDDGLNRFDGYRIQRFYHTIGQDSCIPNNTIYRVVPDRKNNLWITTAEGVCYYDQKTGIFHPFRHDPSDSSSIANDQFVTLFTDKNHVVWLTSPSALYRCDSTGHFEKIPISFQKFTTFRKLIESYSGLYEDRDRRIWATAFTYIYLLDKKTMKATRRFGPIDGNISVMYQGEDMQIWIGAFLGGLKRFNPADGSFTEIRLASPTRVVNTITEWTDQNDYRWLVLGTDDGMILLDPVTLKSKAYGFHPGLLQQRSISGSNVLHVFVDRQNILWIASDGGVSYVEPSRQLFDLWNIYTPTEVVDKPNSDYIYACAENNRGFWMTRWINGGIYNYDKHGQFIKRVGRLMKGAASVDLETVYKPYSIMALGDSVLWFTTDRTLVHYDPASGKAQFYDTPDNLEYTGLRTIVPIDNRHWWIRTRNNGANGIYVFDPVTRRFTRHFLDSAGCKHCVPPYPLDLIQAHNKDIYLTTRTAGLFRYDSASDQFLSVFKFEGKEALQHSNTFESVAEDKQGILWIATFTGLFAFDPVSKKIVRDFSSKELFGDVDVNRVIVDEEQNIWLNTQRGIFCILRDNGQVRQIGTAEGLPNNFTNGILQSASDHNIYSGINGFVVRIRPRDILGNRHPAAAVHFSEATIMDEPSIFRYTAEDEKQMVIAPGQNRFTLDFSVMNYDLSENNRYYYRLDGAMTTWQQNENGHLAFYNLPPGTYTLNVKGGDKYGGMFASEDAVSIIVRPNWWQTAWFKLLCIGVALLLAFIFIRRRIMLIRREASIKQKIAETEMMALRSQMNPHFIFNSLNSIENFMMKNEKRLASSYLNKFARLVRMILDSSRNELVPVIRDMEALQLYVDLEQLRFNNKFSFHMELDPILRDSDHRVPSLLIQPYVENAIVHGLAHSEKEGLRLSIAAWLDGEYVNYIIEDNGIGRQLSGLYNRQNKPHHKSVGLKITEERINIFNQQQHAKGHVSIVDLFDQDGLATGTRVEIKIRAI